HGPPVAAVQCGAAVAPISSPASRRMQDTDLKPLKRESLMRRLALLAAVALIPVSSQAQTLSVETISWLAGCWQMERGGTVIEEQWMAPRGHSMIGMGRTARGDSVTEYEFTRIYRAGSVLVYAANPSGQAGAEFRSTAVGDEVVFENLQHDF